MLAAPAAANLDPSDYIDSSGALDIPAGFSGSFDLAGWDVQLDPSLGVVFAPAQATVGQWTSLDGAGTGLNSTVLDIAFDGSVLYAGGFFTDAGGDADADRIAQFNGGAWSSLGGAGTGLNNRVNSIAFNGGVLYAGGFFTDAGGDADADYIAQFSGGAWSSLGGAGTGLSSEVLDIQFNGGVLYAGGYFTDAGGDADADYIAQFSGGAWSSLGGAGTGLNSVVNDIQFNGGVLYAGGYFTDAGGDADADYIAQFSGGAWASLGGAGTGLNSFVGSIEFDGGVLYAGGDFTNAGGDADADYIAQFSGGAWSSLGGAGTGLNDRVNGIAFNGGVLYAGGDFTNAGGDAPADSIAQFSGGAWASLGGAGTGLSSTVQGIEINDGVLYAGGSFTNAGGDADADKIAQFGLPSASGGGPQQGGSKEINSTGTTTLQSGRMFVSVPASAIPSGETNCRIVIAQKGDSGQYGFELDDTVWDVKIVCDSGEISLLFAPISICIHPKDGVTTDKQLFHRHGGSWNALASTGEKSGYVCGQTQTLSLFTLGEFGLPDTGFAPGSLTLLPAQPAEKTYTAEGLMLEIPQLNVNTNIWGVPQTQNGWDVSWLGNNAGYLYGTAYPSWAGNSVITAHVWNADNVPGPFFHLKDLGYGDQILIHSGGQTYIYEVRSNRLISERNLSVMADSAYSLITLITCETYLEGSGEYLYRRAVQAVLVSVE